MKLLVENYHSMSFINFLLNKLRENILNDIKLPQIKMWDDYINNNKLFYGKYTTHLSTMSIIKLALRTLAIDETEDQCIISVDTEIKIPSTNYNLYRAIKLIDNGNMEFTGMHLFSHAYNEIAENIKDYYAEFKRTVFTYSATSY